LTQIPFADISHYDWAWNYLGNFSFAAGTSGYVVLSDDANEYVVADAVKFESQP
jgi:hypothetical protein